MSETRTYYNHDDIADLYDEEIVGQLEFLTIEIKDIKRQLKDYMDYGVYAGDKDEVSWKNGAIRAKRAKEMRADHLRLAGVKRGITGIMSDEEQRHNLKMDRMAADKDRRFNHAQSFVSYARQTLDTDTFGDIWEASKTDYWDRDTV